MSNVAKYNTRSLTMIALYIIQNEKYKTNLLNNWNIWRIPLVRATALTRAEYIYSYSEIEIATFEYEYIFILQFHHSEYSIFSKFNC